MATAAMARIRADRIFYSSVPAVVAMAIFVGFAPSWFLRPLWGAPPHFEPLTPLLVVHGIAFTAWIALTVMQPLLIASGQRSLHRSLGYAGAGLAAAMVVLTTPALARIPALQSSMPLSGFGSPDLIILAGVLFDRATRGRVHRVWKIGGPLMIGSQILMFPLGFAPFMRTLGDAAMRLPV